MPLQKALLAAAFAIAAFPAGAGVFSTMTGASAPAGATERKYDVATLRPEDLQSCLVDAYTIDTTDNGSNGTSFPTFTTSFDEKTSGCLSAHITSS